MTNNELYEVIKKAINGDIRAKFTIIMEFQELINKEASKLGVFKEECKEYVEEHLFKNIEKFKI